MFMFTVQQKTMSKLTKDEQTSVSLRQNLIKNKELELILLKREQAFFVKDLLKGKGLDNKKTYQIGDDGSLLEEAKPDVKKEKKKK